MRDFCLGRHLLTPAGLRTRRGAGRLHTTTEMSLLSKRWTKVTQSSNANEADMSQTAFLDPRQAAYTRCGAGLGKYVSKLLDAPGVVGRDHEMEPRRALGALAALE